ncbi:MAG: DUF4921 family protein [Candidatus Bipolaricaulia bacterium]
MTEVRQGRLSPRRVIVSEKRGQRPSDWVRRDEERSDRACPFCPGHEGETPPEIWALRDDSGADEPGWQVRVIPNKYPIVEPHELLVETPQHDADLPDLSPNEAERILAVYRDRMSAIAEAEGVAYPALFKNVGRAAGASRAHLHAQLIGLSFVPPAIESEFAMAEGHRETTGGCLYCDTIEAELARDERVVWADERFLVWSPEAAMAPYECWILPRAHTADFLATDDADLEALARVLTRTLAALYGVFEGRFAYNYYVHTTPLNGASRGDAGFHWHLEILPRLGTPAGLEWGSSVFANAVPPERAADELRRRMSDDAA